jgi:hypothetical protein
MTDPGSFARSTARTRRSTGGRQPASVQVDASGFAAGLGDDDGQWGQVFVALLLTWARIGVV